MIETEHQYRITQRWVNTFRQAALDLKKQGPNGVHIQLHEATIAALEGEADILQGQLDEYDGRCFMTAPDV